MDFGRYSLPICAHFEEEWKTFFPLGIPPYSHNPQFNAEAYHYSPTWSLSIRNDGSGMPHPENLIIDNPPDFMCQSSQTTFAPSTALGSPVVFDDILKFHLDRAGANKTPDQSQGGASMIVPTNQTYQGTPVSATPDFLIPSFLPEVADVSAAVNDSKQKQPRGKRRNLRKARKGFAVVSPVSSRQATGIRRTPKRHSCNICGKRYAQSQGVTRHQRETHRASLCMYCNAFKWGRPYRYKAHLEKEHPHVAAMQH
ncbi:hypothetical protein BC826DRAFT_188400 [Russula brevipes]|nr:hypothetical protein BC826DRAFT_188400 [Russula brevipes]